MPGLIAAGVVVRAPRPSRNSASRVSPALSPPGPARPPPAPGPGWPGTGTRPGRVFAGMSIRFGGSRTGRRADAFPVAVERREHGVGAALPGLDGAHVVDHADPRMGVPGDTGLVQGGPHPPAPDGLVRARVAAQVDLAGAGFAGQRGEFPLRRPVPDDQPRAALRELAVQVGQALQQERGARSGRVAPVQQPVVQAEHRHDLLAPGQRRAERRMVVHAEVPAEPDKSNHVRRG